VERLDVKPLSPISRRYTVVAAVLGDRIACSMVAANHLSLVAEEGQAQQ